MRVTTGRATDDRVGFDGLRAVVGAGDGVVGRFPGIVCVARCSDPEPLREFLAVCAEVAGPEPGWELARRLATWMSGPDAPGPELRFGTVAAAGDKLAFYLVGEVDARVDAVGGLSLSGAHAAIGTDRLLSPPASPVVLSMDGGDVRADPADVHDLRAGVVPGAGVVLRPTGFGLDDVRRGEEDAGGVHEWFDTGEAASDPFADPPRVPDVPVQRAAGVQVGGRNGVAREPGPEATAEAAEPEPEDVPAAGAGRHALDLPDARADPLSGDFPTAEPDDPFGTDERRYPPDRKSDLPEPARGASVGPRAERGYPPERPNDLPDPAWGASGESRAERGYPPDRLPHWSDSAGGARAEAGVDRGSDVREPGRGDAEPRPADLEQRPPRPFAGQRDPALADPVDSQAVTWSGHALEEAGPPLDGPSPATSNRGSEAPHDDPRSGPSVSAWAASSAPLDGSPPAGRGAGDGASPPGGAPAGGHVLGPGGPRSGPAADAVWGERPATPGSRALEEAPARLDSPQPPTSVRRGPGGGSPDRVPAASHDRRAGKPQSGTPAEPDLRDRKSVV